MITWGRRFANPLTESIENVARSGVNPAFAERREQERQVQERARETQQNDATLRVLGNAFNGLMQAGMRRTNKEGLVYTRNNNDKRPVPTPRTVIVNTTKVIREECQNKHSENPEEKKEWKIAEDRLERERINMTREIMEELNRKGNLKSVRKECEKFDVTHVGYTRYILKTKLKKYELQKRYIKTFLRAVHGDSFEKVLAEGLTDEGMYIWLQETELEKIVWYTRHMYMLANVEVQHNALAGKKEGNAEVKLTPNDLVAMQHLRG
ncbi:unnamed protein product [Bemisia tabaci]|uniref:Uncharacterized protein n=1 Tax=Bemisia tabaci TaxID=7038 RepID=A0A9P0A6S1_BEMTA|nr:unnamed protein product [Bemisia tabaci]